MLNSDSADNDKLSKKAGELILQNLIILAIFSSKKTLCIWGNILEKDIMTECKTQAVLPIRNQNVIVTSNNRKEKFFKPDSISENLQSKNFYSFDSAENNKIPDEENIQTKDNCQNKNKVWTTIGIIGGLVLSSIVLKKTGYGNKLLPKIFKPEMNETMSEANRGLRSVLYGKKVGDKDKFGLIHLITSIKYRKELIDTNTYTGVINSLKSSEHGKNIARIVVEGAHDAVSPRYKFAFRDLERLDNIKDFDTIKTLANIRSSIRKYAEKIFLNSTVKLKKMCANINSRIKTKLCPQSQEQSVLNIEMAKKLLPLNAKIPENLSEQELREYITREYKRFYNTDKCIEDLLAGKSPTFYRFVSETELRILKNGCTVQPRQRYCLNMVDVTSNPNLNWNQYRLTFKSTDGWNLFAKDSKIKTNNLGKYYLHEGGYTIEDVAYYERIK